MANKKILVVEDEKSLVEMLKMRLEKEGYSVIASYDGKDGLDKAKKENPDLIILDLMLPVMDGYKVCALLKKDSRYSKIPIIMFTAKAQDSDRELGLEMGADAYITKPFDAAMLLAKIKELIKE